jgi:hypothetical protein
LFGLSALRRVFGLGRIGLVAALVVFALFEWTLTSAFEPGALNGSYRYLPALCGLVAMSLAAARYAPAMSRPLAWASLLLVVAVSLRTVDLALCGIWPWGTHFLWHMLNAAVLYLSAHALRKQAV